MATRGARALGLRDASWLLTVAAATREWFIVAPYDAPDDLAAFVLGALPPRGDPALAGVRLRAHAGPSAERPQAPIAVRRWQPVKPTMGRRPWPDVLELDTVDDLARRLELDHGQLAWLADVRGLERSAAPRLRNYRYRWLPRNGALPRLIERPKARLMESQRIVLREILDAIPAHDAAHGFVRHRSVRTHAARHVGTRVVVGFDLEDFFASVGPGRVFATLRTAGYSRRVAHVLTALCTNVVPRDEWAALPPPTGTPAAIARHRRLGRRLATPHLPQAPPPPPRWPTWPRSASIRA